jgi:hypothetical protein
MLFPLLLKLTVSIVTNILEIFNFYYRLVEDLGVILGSKLCFYQHVSYKYSQLVKLIGLIRFITNNFSSLDSNKTQCGFLFRSKLAYASIV